MVIVGLERISKNSTSDKEDHMRKAKVVRAKRRVKTNVRSISTRRKTERNTEIQVERIV